MKEGVGEPESTEVILNRLSTAFQQKSDEPLSTVSHVTTHVLFSLIYFRLILTREGFSLLLNVHLPLLPALSRRKLPRLSCLKNQEVTNMAHNLCQQLTLLLRHHPPLVLVLLSSNYLLLILILGLHVVSHQPPSHGIVPFLSLLNLSLQIFFLLQSHLLQGRMLDHCHEEDPCHLFREIYLSLLKCLKPPNFLAVVAPVLNFLCLKPHPLHYVHVLGLALKKDLQRKCHLRNSKLHLQDQVRTVTQSL